jgi:Fe-S-cluster formation regulator IscX/YfhJ
MTEVFTQKPNWLVCKILLSSRTFTLSSGVPSMSLRSGHITRRELDVTQKRVVKNPRFDNVRGATDSGQRREPTIQQKYGRFLAECPFKRVRLTTLARWVLHAKELHDSPQTFRSGESIYPAAGPAAPPSIVSMAGTEASVAQEDEFPHMFLPPDVDDDAAAELKEDLAMSRVTKPGSSEFRTGQLDVLAAAEEAASRPAPMTVRRAHEHHERSFVILDLRPEEADFSDAHIWGSWQATPASLRRSVNPLPAMLHRFVRRPDAIIVIVAGHEQQKDMIAAGERLVSLGVDQRNLVVLVQPFPEFADEEPDCVTGARNPWAGKKPARTQELTAQQARTRGMNATARPRTGR